MDHLRELDTTRLLSLAPELLQAIDTHFESVQALVYRLSERSCSQDDAKQILKVLISYSTPDAALTNTFLHLLSVSPHREMVIDHMTQLIQTTDEASINSLIDAYRILMYEDRKLLVPIIGSLLDLPLSGKQKRECFFLALSALPTIDELDLPVLVRLILYALTKDFASEGIDAIRRETNKLSVDALSPVLEVVSNSIKVNVLAGTEFLNAIDQAEHLVPIDVFVLIMLMSSAHMKDSKIAWKSMLHALNRRALSLDLLRLVFKASSDTSWLQGDQSPLLLVGEYFLNCANFALIDWSQELLSYLYVHFPRLRMSILNSLFYSAYNKTHFSTDAHARCEENQIHERHFQQQRCYTASSTLLTLCLYSGHVVAPYAYLFEDMLTQWINSYSSESEDTETMLVYKSQSLIAMHCLSKCLAILVNHNSNLLNSLMIYVQKQTASNNVEAHISGLIVACHLLPELPREDVCLLVRLILRMASTCSITSRMYIFDILIQNYNLFEDAFVSEIYHNWLMPLILKIQALRHSETARSSDAANGHSLEPQWDVENIVRWHMACLSYKVVYPALHTQLLFQCYCLFYSRIYPNDASAFLKRPFLHSAEWEQLSEQGFESPAVTEKLKADPELVGRLILHCYYGHLLCKAHSKIYLHTHYAASRGNASPGARPELPGDSRVAQFLSQTNFLKFGFFQSGTLACLLHCEVQAFKYLKFHRQLVDFKSCASELKTTWCHAKLDFETSFLLLQANLTEPDQIEIAIEALKTVYYHVKQYLILDERANLSGQEIAEDFYPENSYLDREILSSFPVFLNSRQSLLVFMFFAHMEESARLSGNGLDSTERNMFDVRGNVFFNVLVESNILPSLLLYSEMCFDRIEHANGFVCNMDLSNITEHSSIVTERNQLTAFLSLCYSIFSHIFSFSSNSAAAYDDLAMAFKDKVTSPAPRRLAVPSFQRRKLLQGTIDQLISMWEERWTKCEDIYLAISLLKLLIEVSIRSARIKQIAELIMLTLMRSYPSRALLLIPPSISFPLTSLIASLPESSVSESTSLPYLDLLYSLVRLPTSSSLWSISYKHEVIIRFLVHEMLRHFDHRFGCERRLLAAMCEATHALVKGGEERGEYNHPTWKMMTYSSLPIFCIAFMHEIYKKIFSFDFQGLSAEIDNPYGPFLELVHIFFKLIQIYILCIIYVYHPHCCSVSHWLKISSAFCDTIRLKLDECIFWRSGHAPKTSKSMQQKALPGIHVRNLIPLFKKTFMIVNYLRTFSSMIKFSSKISKLLPITGADLKAIPFLTKTMERCSDRLLSRAKKHHIEVDLSQLSAKTVSQIEENWMKLMTGASLLDLGNSTPSDTLKSCGGDLDNLSHRTQQIYQKLQKHLETQQIDRLGRWEDQQEGLVAEYSVIGNLSEGEETEEEEDGELMKQLEELSDHFVFTRLPSFSKKQKKRQSLATDEKGENDESFKYKLYDKKISEIETLDYSSQIQVKPSLEKPAADKFATFKFKS